jgi:YggT family protein
MAGTGLNAILFLISCIFDFYIMILFVRLVLSWVHADYNHPLTQFVVKLSSPIIKPIKKFIPDYRKLETATLVLIILVTMLKYLLLSLMSYGFPNIFGLFIAAIGDCIRLLLVTLSIALILQAILSWVMPNSPAYYTLSKLTSPITDPLHKFIPPLAGIDITPLIAIIILQLLVILIADPLVAYGVAIATGTI